MATLTGVSASAVERVTSRAGQMSGFAAAWAWIYGVRMAQRCD
jgi:hypothetical protein